MKGETPSDPDWRSHPGLVGWEQKFPQSFELLQGYCAKIETLERVPPDPTKTPFEREQLRVRLIVRNPDGTERPAATTVIFERPREFDASSLDGLAAALRLQLGLDELPSDLSKRWSGEWPGEDFEAPAGLFFDMVVALQDYHRMAIADPAAGAARAKAMIENAYMLGRMVQKFELENHKFTRRAQERADQVGGLHADSAKQRRKNLEHRLRYTKLFIEKNKAIWSEFMRAGKLSKNHVDTYTQNVDGLFLFWQDYYSDLSDVRSKGARATDLHIGKRSFRNLYTKMRKLGLQSIEDTLKS